MEKGLEEGHYWSQGRSDGDLNERRSPVDGERRRDLRDVKESGIDSNWDWLDGGRGKQKSRMTLWLLSSTLGRRSR